MRERKVRQGSTSLRGLARLGAIVSLVVLSVACTGEDFADVRSVDPDPAHAPRPLIAATPDFADATVATVGLPFAVDQESRILIGDVAGGADDEIVVVAPDGIAVVTLSGKVRSRASLADVRFAGGVLIDADGDGKLDVVVGTRVGSDPAVRIFSGTGKLLIERPVRVPGGAFASASPQVDLDGSIIVSATKTWLAGPRGLIRLDPATLDLLWFAPVPTGVRAVARSGDLLLVSTVTELNGEFNIIGTAGEDRRGFDAWPWLLALDADGLPAAEVRLADDHPSIDLITWLVPLSDRLVLAHVIGSEEELLLVDLISGRVVAQTSPAGAIASLAVLAGSSSRISVTSTTASAWRLDLYDDALQTVETWSGTGAAPRPVAGIGASDASTADSVLVARDGGVAMLAGRDAATRSADAATGKLIRELVSAGLIEVTLSESSLLVVTASGSELSVVRAGM